MEWIKNNDAGGGAFKLESWKPGAGVSVYVRFDDWKWGPLPKLKKVIVREVPSAGNRRALLERGDADISFLRPAAQGLRGNRGASRGEGRGGGGGLGLMRLNDPAVMAEVTAAFRCYEEAPNDNDVTTLTTSFWTSPLTIRFGIGENLLGHDAIAAFRRARPDVDLHRTLTNTAITTYGADFATANTEFVKRDTGRRGRQSQTWVRTEAGWRGERVSFLPAQD